MNTYERLRPATLISLMIVTMFIWKMPDAVKAIPIEMGDGLVAMDIDGSGSSTLDTMRNLHQYGSERKGKRLRNDDSSMLYQGVNSGVKRTKALRQKPLFVSPFTSNLQGGAQHNGQMSIFYDVLQEQLGGLEATFADTESKLQTILLDYRSPGWTGIWQPMMQRELKNWKMVSIGLSNLLHQCANVKAQPSSPDKECWIFDLSMQLKECFQEMDMIRDLEFQLKFEEASHLEIYQLRLQLKTTIEMVMFVMIPDLHNLKKIDQEWFGKAHDWLTGPETMERVSDHIYEIYELCGISEFEPTMDYLMKARPTEHLHTYLKALPSDQKDDIIKTLTAKTSYWFGEIDNKDH